MWTPSSLIADAVSEMKLDSGSFQLLSKSESSQVLQRVTSRFLTDENVLFWWEHLKLPSRSWKPNSDAFKHLSSIVPDPDKSIWFIPHDDPENPVFLTSTSTAIKVIGECAPFEYAICNTTLDWMIIENHHDCLFAVGDTVIQKMNQLAELAK